MKDCVFCKIVANKIPSYTIYEDEVVKAFLDISQGTPGHVLVIPKQHVANIYEYDEELAAAVFQRIPMIARAVQASNPAIKGLNIVNNNGEIAYQSVFHSHFHLVPRYTDHDDFSMQFKDNSDKYSPDELTAIQESISEHIGE